MILIKNGRLINPKTNADEVVDIIIKDEKIYRINEYINEDENNFELIIDAKNKLVIPGLIDIHVHFRDPGFEYKEDIYSGAMSAARGGFTTVICMANTNPVVDNEETLKYILNRAKDTPINVLQTASITVGLKGNSLVDMEKLKEIGAIGFTDDGVPLMDNLLTFKAMMKAKELDMPLSFHEEDKNFVKIYGINEGEISKKLGFEGAKNIAEDIMISRDCIMAIETGAKVNIQHLSSGNSVDIIRAAKLKGANITAEVSPHHFSLTEEAVLKYGTNAKMNPPLRTERDRIKLIEGLRDDTIEIIATDHAPHSKEEKDREFINAPSGIVGLETSLALGITNLVNKGYLGLSKLIEKMTINPARLYKLDSGSIEVGKKADIVIVDINEEWTVKDFQSKSLNSPFIGEKLKGKVKYTICNGKIIWKD